MRFALSTKRKRLLVILGFCVLFLATRLPFLGYDEINPDAVNWHIRSEQFIVGLKGGDLLKTYQHYHPGVTLMWIMGAPIELYRQVNPQDRVYTEANFIIQHQLAKYSLVLVQLILSVVLICALQRFFGFRKALLGTVLFSMEPWFLGNSRLLHMDALLALFVILALTFAYRYFLNRRTWDAVICGLFCGLAFLTKSVGALLIPIILVSWTGLLIKKRFAGKNPEQNSELILKVISFQQLMAFLVSAGLTVFVLFPALWQKPVFVLSDIYNEGLRVGTRRGHEQIVLGEQVDEAGAVFYPLVLALKTSPLLWLGLLLFVYQMVKNRPAVSRTDKYFVLLLSAFYLVYLFSMSLVSKKIDRYMVPLFPYLGILAGLGIMTSLNQVKDEVSWLKSRGHSLKHKYFKLTAIVGLATVTIGSALYPLVTYYPYYFTYTNPLFGSATQANNIVGQKPFGVGIWELKQFIGKNYGKDIPLGFIDRKPMSMIYKNSKLFDIRETGTSKYDLIVLGPNEVMPPTVTEGKFTFTKVDSVFINGLEFWRIYQKDGLTQ